MTGGFSFNGVDIQDIGLTYVPSVSQIYVYDSKPKISQQTFEAHRGGYFYGAQSAPKDFTLRCIFQDSYVNDGIIDRIKGIFKIGTSGKLVFQKREWLYYIATVTSLDFTKFTNRQNGYVIIQMKAYYPYGRCDGVSVSNQIYSAMNRDLSAGAVIDGFDAQTIMNLKYNTGLLSQSMTPGTSYTSGANSSNSYSFTLYNAGSEMADVAIKIAGNVGQGVTIQNVTTGQKCQFVGLTPGATLPSGNSISYLLCDSMNGKVVGVSGLITTTQQLAFMYHSGGFINLAPAYPIKRDIILGQYFGSNKSIITSAGRFTPDDAGKYIYIASKRSQSGSWKKIIEYRNKNQVVISGTLTTDDATGTIATMNQIRVTPKTTMNLTTLQFIYKPTFS